MTRKGETTRLLTLAQLLKRFPATTPLDWAAMVNQHRIRRVLDVQPIRRDVHPEAKEKRAA